MAEIPKTYDPAVVESEWYEYWMEQRCFTADAHSRKAPYSIVIPPPNVTGILHMGHVLNNTIQDILCRKARMEGKEVLWLPGTDHAGIATQVVVEKKIKKEEKIGRRELGREKFLERVWEWKNKHGGIIIEQLKKLGASCDWSRERFTMDPAYSKVVTETFIDLFQKGLIYRGKRMVNWCPVTLTALSDEEVNMKPQNGFMYYFKVEVVEEPGTWLTIATTRPETIPGDTAVAVNPKDERYTRLIGKHVRRPLPAEASPGKKEIPIIGDHQVEFEFGTGVLKVTPAHDKADFEIGQRHGLPVVDILNPDASLNEHAGEDLRGLDRFKARKVAAEKLKELGVLVKEEPYQNNVGFSERADVPIEPRLSEQWFLKYPSARQATEAAETGELKFFPDRWEKVYEHWMHNLRDWCISRQLWWGHRIPVWYRGEEMRCQAESPGADWTQDPDVLDTWFSSWLWPFVTMNDETRKKFYPTSVLVSGPDILFFWVARMVMAGLEFTGKIPFSHVYLTGIVRDKSGRKMSKSLGNSPDPLDLISKYSADALRFGVMRSAPLGQDVLFDEQHVEQGRNFCTKLWNACRYRQMQAGEVQAEIDPARLTIDDKWMLIRLDKAISEISDSLAEYKFNEATSTLYRFFWSELCDWYLEASKAVFFGDDAAQKANTLAVLDFALSHVLRLMHPFLPFVTEELWHGLGYNTEMPEGQGGKSIMFAPWPKPLGADFYESYGLDESDERIAEAKYDLVTKARNLRREFNISSGKKVGFVFDPEGELSAGDAAVLKILLNAEKLEIASGEVNLPKGTPNIQSPLGALYLPLEGLVDIEAEKARVRKEIARIESEIAKVQDKLNNPNFTRKVPATVLEEHKRRLADWQAKHQGALKAMEHLEV
jgi:valyl-tRNA synthetase